MASMRSPLNPLKLYFMLNNLGVMTFSFSSPSMHPSSLRHCMDSIEMPLIIFSQKSKTSINNLCCLLYLQHKFWLRTVGFVAAEISTYQMYQSFFLYISWDKYRHRSILQIVILSSKRPS